MNIVDQIRDYAKKTPDKIAIQYNEIAITYKVFINCIHQVGNGLLSKSTEKNNKVAIFMRNKVEFLEVFLGAISAGYIPVPMDPKWSDKEINYVLSICEPTILFIDEEFMGKVMNVRYPVIVVGGNYIEWRQRYSTRNPTILHQPTTLFIGFTSGTTGDPKGFVRSHDSWIESCYATKDAFLMKQQDHVIAPGPLVHSMSLFAAFNTLFIGATFQLIDKFSPVSVVQVMQRVENTVLYLVPTMIEGLLSYLRKNTVNFFEPKSIISSGAKWTEESKLEVLKLFSNSDVFEFYGSSEASYIAYLPATEQIIKPKSVGKPFPNVKISIRHDDGTEVETGEIGQLFVSSNMMFDCYFKNELETDKVLQGSWLALGDYALKDQEGYLYIVGRAKNMMITGGLNVFPEEIEDVLRSLDEVSEVMVYGHPDTYWGEKIVAIIQWKSNKELSHLQIKEYCRKHLATYKIPQLIKSVKDFQYTGSGKIARDKMQKQIVEV